MKKHRALFAILVALIALTLLLTRFNFRLLHRDAVALELGAQVLQSERAREIDAQVRAHLNFIGRDEELRARLQKPSRIQKIEPFVADVCEVSQRDYESFIVWHAESPNTKLNAAELQSSSSGHRIAGLLRSPASGVTFDAAAAYCEAAGGRLPSAAEWEAMAGGRSGRLWPWGNQWRDDAWPYADPNRNAAQICGAHRATDSPEGVHDLAGNVVEWSRGAGKSPAVHGAPASRVGARALQALNAGWLEIPPHTRSHQIGFRCIYSPPQPTIKTLPWGATPQTARISGGDYPLGLPSDARLPQLAMVLAGETAPESFAALANADETERARVIRISRCEVRRRDYRRFLADPLVKLGLFANENEPRDTDYTPLNWATQLESPDLPLSGIHWWAADAYARWADGRLPTREQWQAAATAAHTSAYPWGNAYAPDAAVTGDLADVDIAGPRICEDALRDQTAAGLRHLAGNVSEWTRSIAADRGGLGVWAQGGNWLLPGESTASGFFGRLVPLGHRSPGIGLRVVYE